MTLYKDKWALVTGASSGLGKEFALQLAAKGANLVIVARRLDRLEALAEVLKPTGVKIMPLVCDLADPAAPAALYKALSDQGIHIDILINNAGFGLTGKFVSRTWQEQGDFIQLMVTAYAQLVHLFMPYMIEQKYGRIINVASVAGLVPPSSGHTLYGPSKAFLVSMSQSLACEGRAYNVLVSALCPGFTYTEFHDVTETRDRMNAMPSYMMMDAVPTVEKALQAVEKDHTVFVPGLIYKFIVWLSMRLPRSFVENLADGRLTSFRKN